MNRIELLREYIDGIILRMPDAGERRCAYLHLYGVAQNCALLALRRGADSELAVLAGMLHDIYTYATMNPVNHAAHGAILAREILQNLQITTAEETDIICNAIRRHSDKSTVHSAFDELLKDADVLQHCLYNPSFEVMAHEQRRYARLKDEFGIM